MANGPGHAVALDRLAAPARWRTRMRERSAPDTLTPCRSSLAPSPCTIPTANGRRTSITTSFYAAVSKSAASIGSAADRVKAAGLGGPPSATATPTSSRAETRATGTGFAHLLAGRFDDASSWAGKALREDPNYLPAAAVTSASHALAGRLEEARQAMTRLRRIDPALRMSTLKNWFPIRRPEHFASWAEGLRRAGLPE